MHIMLHICSKEHTYIDIYIEREIIMRCKNIYIFQAHLLIKVREGRRSGELKISLVLLLFFRHRFLINRSK